MRQNETYAASLRQVWQYFATLRTQTQSIWQTHSKAHGSRAQVLPNSGGQKAAGEQSAKYQKPERVPQVAGAFVEKLGDYQILKTDSAAMS